MKRMNSHRWLLGIFLTAGLLLLLHSCVYVQLFWGLVDEYGGDQIHNTGVADIDENGGAVYVGDEDSEIEGASVNIPAGAIDNEVINVQINHMKDVSIEGYNNVKQVVGLEPSGYQFKKPVTVGLPYNLMGNVDPNNLKMIHYDPEKKTTEVLPPVEIDTDYKFMYGQTSHFSWFLVVEEEKAYETFLDKRDNITYKTIQIGGQTWMAENLKHQTRLSQVHDDDPEWEAVYGRLYTFEDARTNCPQGWHLPTDDEWLELERFAGLPDAERFADNSRGADVGGRLKEAGLAHWNDPNEGGTNAFGFSALPAGLAEADAAVTGIGRVALFWTATDVEDTHAWTRELDYHVSFTGRMLRDKLDYLSVRCIKD